MGNIKIFYASLGFFVTGFAKTTLYRKAQQIFPPLPDCSFKEPGREDLAKETA
jgi:hypothetical protein